VIKQQDVLVQMLKETTLHKRTQRLKEKERKYKLEWMKEKKQLTRKAPSVSLQSATGSLRQGSTGLMSNLNREFSKNDSIELKLSSLANMMDERLGFVTKKQKVINMLKQFVDNGFVEQLLNANRERTRDRRATCGLSSSDEDSEQGNT